MNKNPFEDEFLRDDVGLGSSLRDLPEILSAAADVLRMGSVFNRPMVRTMPKQPINKNPKKLKQKAQRLARKQQRQKT